MDIFYSDVEVDAVIAEADADTPQAAQAKADARADMAGVDFTETREHYLAQLPTMARIPAAV